MWTQKESFVREVLAREISQVGDIYPFLELVRGFVEVTVFCISERGSRVFPLEWQNTKGTAPVPWFPRKLTTKFPPLPPQTPLSPASSTISIVLTLTPFAQLSCTDAHYTQYRSAWRGIVDGRRGESDAQATSASFVDRIPYIGDVYNHPVTG